MGLREKDEELDGTLRQEEPEVPHGSLSIS